MSAQDDLKKLIDAGLADELHPLRYCIDRDCRNCDEHSVGCITTWRDACIALAVRQAEQVVTLREVADDWREHCEAARRDACSLEFDLGLARSELRRLQQKLGALEARP
jgi:hypothetical protein